MSGRRRQPPAADLEAINHGTEDSDVDANPAVKDSDAAFAGLVQPFMASMNAVIATTITTASMNTANIAASVATAVQTVSKAVVSIYLSIDSLKNMSTEMNTREGKALWYMITRIRMPGAWTKAGVTVNVVNASAFTTLTSYWASRSEAQ